MNYNKNIDNNKGEGNNPKPVTKFPKISFILLIVGLILFCIYNYRTDISKSFFNAENDLNSQSDTIKIVEDEDNQDDDPLKYEEGIIDETPITKQPQSKPQLIPPPSSPIPDDIILETFEGRGGKKGLRDKNTKKVYLEPLYDEIDTVISKSVFLWKVRLGNKYGWLEPDGTVIVPIEYDEIRYLPEYGSTNHNPHLVVRKGNKLGIIDLYSRKMILPPEYTDIWGTGTIKNKDGKLVPEYYILSNEKGTGLYNIVNKKLIIPLEYSSVSLTNTEGFLVQKGMRYGAVNHRNEIIAPIKYTRLPIWHDYKDMVTFEIAEEAYECYDNKGYRTPTPTDKRKLSGANLGVTIFNGADSKQGVKTSNGHIQIAAQYDYVFPVKTGEEILYIVSLNGKYGVVDNYNKSKIAFSYDYISALNAEYDSSKGSRTMTRLRVYQNQKCGLICLSDMKTIIPIEYQNIGLATNDFMWVKQNDKYGLINSKNTILLAIDNPLMPKIELGSSEDKCAIRMLEGKRKDYVFYNTKGEKIARLY